MSYIRHILELNNVTVIETITTSISSQFTFWVDLSRDYKEKDKLEQLNNYPIKTNTIICLFNTECPKMSEMMKEVITKIVSINSNYIISYESKREKENNIKLSILIAHLPKKKYCIHKYLTVCEDNIQSPGFGDFLRGTVALFNFCKLFDYTFFLDSNHPLFRYIKPNNKYLIHDVSSEPVLNYLPNFVKTERLLHFQDTYNMIFMELNNLFFTGKSFRIITNSFYDLNDSHHVNNYGKIPEDCRKFLIDILTPTEEVEIKIRDVFTFVYNLILTPNTPYIVIHLRFGDKFLYHNTENDEMYSYYYDIITKNIQERGDSQIPFILFSDTSKIAKKLQKNIPNLYYWDNKKTHIGDLNNPDISLSVFDTIVDFFIMSRSIEIITNGSGFSNIISEIYKIKYTVIVEDDYYRDNNK